MDVIYDGVEVLCLPDSAKCTLANKNPLNIDKCPDGHNCCEGDYPYSEWGAEEGKEYYVLEILEIAKEF